MKVSRALSLEEAELWMQACCFPNWMSLLWSHTSLVHVIICALTPANQCKWDCFQAGFLVLSRSRRHSKKNLLDMSDLLSDILTSFTSRLIACTKSHEESSYTLERDVLWAEGPNACFGMKSCDTSSLSKWQLAELAKSLQNYSAQNRDCNYQLLEWRIVLWPVTRDHWHPSRLALVSFALSFSLPLSLSLSLFSLSLSLSSLSLPLSLSLSVSPTLL